MPEKFSTTSKSKHTCTQLQATALFLLIAQHLSCFLSAVALQCFPGLAGATTELFHIAQFWTMNSSSHFSELFYSSRLCSQNRLHPDTSQGSGKGGSVFCESIQVFPLFSLTLTEKTPFKNIKIKILCGRMQDMKSQLDLCHSNRRTTFCLQQIHWVSKFWKEKSTIVLLCCAVVLYY